MRIAAVLVTVLLLAGLAAAQAMVPIPAFGTTYSASMTRGLYCQAPVDFTVVGLRVPDEANHGLQNVCLYKHTSAPPAYTGTVPLTPRFSAFGAPSATILPCAVPFRKGDWMMVIGACGDASGLKNSYATPPGAFATSIFGAATTLYRCGIQSNIITTPPPHPVWSENSGQISRVEVYVVPGYYPGYRIPLPAFSRTYSSTQTRGFYCQAPLPFAVVGVRVPDESNHGLQNVCLYKDASAPPAFSSTVLLTPQFSKFGEPSANIIPCLVPYNLGEWMIALGACGDASGLKNSYGPAGCFVSSILGAPTTLCRAGVQANIVTATPPHAIWSENAFEVSRVEVFVSAAGITGSGTGGVGTTMTFLLAAPGDSGLPYQMASSFGEGPIPIDTRLLGLSYDSLLVLSVMNLAPGTFINYSGVLSRSGTAKAGLAIPKIPSLIGIRIFTAYVTVLPAAPSGVANISNTFLFTVQ
ncbi:MAG: hypothetical protein JXQ29_04695 [Planctomycetes bacterium]|nr:hypothetical protein [Planctomycetota bacterium]